MESGAGVWIAKVIYSTAPTIATNLLSVLPSTSNRTLARTLIQRLRKPIVVVIAPIHIPQINPRDVLVVLVPLPLVTSIFLRAEDGTRGDARPALEHAVVVDVSSGKEVFAGRARAGSGVVFVEDK